MCAIFIAAKLEPTLVMRLCSSKDVPEGFELFAGVKSKHDIRDSLAAIRMLHPEYQKQSDKIFNVEGKLCRMLSDTKRIYKHL